MSSYFNYFSFSRAKENKEALEKTNPKTPVLNDEDEQFLHKITSEEAPAPPLPDRPIVISDDGQAKEADSAQTGAASEILPASSPAVEGEKEEKTTEGAELQSAAEQGEPEASKEAAEDEKLHVAQDVDQEQPNVGAAVKDFEAPEGAETEGTKKDEELVEKDGDGSEITAEEKASVEKQNEHEKEELGESKPAKRTWASYIPPISIPSIRSKSPRPGTDAATKDKKPSEESAKDEKPAEEPAKDEKPSEESAKDDKPSEETGAEQKVEDTKTNEAPKPEGEAATEETKETTKDESTTEEVKEKVEEPKEKSEDKGKAVETSPRTWASYIPAIPAIPAMPSMPSMTGSKSKAEDPILNEDGTVNEEATRERDEKEVSVLLDNLNLSSINNRVFSFSKESQKLYEDFTVVLKDIVNGGPTAYSDLEDLIKNNEKHLDQMFGNMPPFVKTLVKSLPAKFASSLGPEIMAAASEKPGNDMQARMAAASAPSSSAGTSSVNKKQKRKIPSAKSLVTEKGAVASMLRNILNFLKVRFPAVMTGTNVLMSLAVFILLFVFWYCHKRGKETRLLKERKAADSEKGTVEEESESDEGESEEDTIAEGAEALAMEDNDLAEEVEEVTNESEPVAEKEAETEGSKTEEVEEPKTDEVEEPKTDEAEEPKTDEAEEPKTDEVEEPKTEEIEEAEVEKAGAEAEK